METFYSPGSQQRPPQLKGHDAVRCLGSGAQGQVWLMSPHNGTEAVAAKFLGPIDDKSPDDNNAFQARHNESQLTREWRVLTQFRHEHMIAVHDLAEDERGGPVIIMEHAAGGSLGHIIGARGVLSVGEAVTVLTPIGQVLAFLHGRGAVHGDVAPGNILLSAAGKPLLADFGMGRLLGQGSGGAVGTPGFSCSLDVVRDEAADVYALAAVGWYALTGIAPQSTRDRPPLGSIVSDIPSELVAALEAGLNEDPALRPTAAAFAQAVFRSAPAAPVALAQAVHPSVLPELQTRHERADQRSRRRRAGRWSWRRPESLEPLWGAGRPAARPRLRRSGAAALAATALLGVTAVFWVISMSGGLMIDSKQVTGSQVGQGSVSENRSEDLAWTGALPADIQRGMVATEPVSALHALAWLRSFSLANSDQGLLERISVAGSSALAADTAIAQELLQRTHTLTGFETNILWARTIDSRPSAAGTEGTTMALGQAAPADGATVTVRAVVETSPFAEQDSQGVLVHRAVEAQSQELDFVMARVGERWRIQQILATENK